MKTHPLKSSNWLWVALAAVALGLWFVAPFLGVIALAALMAFIFYPTYVRLSQRLNKALAGVVTFLYSVVIVLIPVVLIVAFTFIQISQLALQLSTSFNPLPESVQNVIGSINDVTAAATGGTGVITEDRVIEFVRDTLPTAIRGAVGWLTTVIGGIPMAIVLIIMYIVLFYEFLLYGKKILKTIIALSPFQTDITRLYLVRIGVMAKAMAIGEVFIAFIIAVLSAGVLAVFLGMGDYFLLLTVVFTLLNLVPLGSGVIIFPILIFALIFGPFWPAAIATVLYILISNLEVYIRPKIIPPSITLSPGLTMLAAFGGVVLFGLIGVVYGPIIMIVIVTSVQMYMEYYEKQEKRTGKKKPVRA